MTEYSFRMRRLTTCLVLLAAFLALVAGVVTFMILAGNLMEWAERMM